MLMKDNDITQTKLADILHMPQSNVSKALSENDKKSFTLDQLVGIAKHFRVSIDFLIGNKRFENRDISPRAVAEYFVRLIEHNDISIIKYMNQTTILTMEVLDVNITKKLLNTMLFSFHPIGTFLMVWIHRAKANFMQK